jgi:hypothetical protein
VNRDFFPLNFEQKECFIHLLAIQKVSGYTFCAYEVLNKCLLNFTALNSLSLEYQAGFE